MSEVNFQDLLDKASAAARAAAEAARSAAHAAKLSIAIAAEEDKIRTAYQQLGKQYFQDTTAGVPTQGPAYEKQIALIQEAATRIAELKERKNAAPQPAPAPEDDTPQDFVVVTDEE